MLLLFNNILTYEIKLLIYYNGVLGVVLINNIFTWDKTIDLL